MCDGILETNTSKQRKYTLNILQQPYDQITQGRAQRVEETKIASRLIFKNDMNADDRPHNRIEKMLDWRNLDAFHYGHQYVHNDKKTSRHLEMLSGEKSQNRQK